MSEEVEAEVPPEELDKDFVVVADSDEAGEDGKGGGKAMKKFQWRKLTDEDSIYTKGGGGGGSSNMNQNHDDLSSQGRWKKSALLERKPKDIDYEGTMYSGIRFGFYQKTLNHQTHFFLNKAKWFAKQLASLVYQCKAKVLEFPSKKSDT